jgi:hypothetical protein
MLSSRTFLQLIRILFGTTFRDVNWVHLWHRLLIAVRNGTTSRGEERHPEYAVYSRCGSAIAVRG